MRRALIQFLSWLGVLVAMVFVLYPFNPAWSVLGLIVVPAIFLSWVDLGRALRKALSQSRTTHLLGVLAVLPQALFGLVSLLAGLAIIVAFFFWPAKGEGNNWVVLAVVPLLVFFGIRWLREAFKHG
ncbi:MAG TPA: hypothetical protein VJS64_00430 [Pyrinomonadaceae bacterium]|nr:hypothetical protein [Pyrinomonadaceae bacterium]